MLQRAFDILTGLFDRVGLRTNTKKTEDMIMLPGKIRTCLSADAYRARMDAEFREGWKGGEADCDICGTTLKEVSLRKHLETQHDVYRSFALVGPAAEPPTEGRRWAVWRQVADEKLRCPVPGCPQPPKGQGVRGSFNLR